MAIKSLDQVRSEQKTVDTGAAPEISVNPLQTEFRENTWSEEIFHPFQQSNWIASKAMDETGDVDNTPDPEFNFYANIKGTEYEQDADYFTEAQNEPYLNALKLRYNREKRNRASMERGGWSTMGWSFVGALLGPENFIPGTLAVRGAKQGYSLTKSAMNVGGAGALATTISEYGLQSSQGLLTGEESLLNIGFGTLFSAGLGSGLAALANKGIKGKIARKFDNAMKYSDDFKVKLEEADLKDPEVQIALSKEADDIITKGQLEEVEQMAKMSEELQAKLNDPNEKFDDLLKEARRIKRQNNLSAASDAPTLDDLSIYGRAASKTAEATKWFNPILRSLQSPSAHARRVAGNLFENPIIMKMNDYRDSPAALESKIKNWTDGRLAEVIWRMGTTGNDGIYTHMIKSGVHMTRSEFRKQVGRAMRRNDGNLMINGEDTGRPSGEFNEHIVKAAKVARDDLFEYARKELNKVGVEIDSKKSSTADSFLTRVWSTKKLQTGEAKFKSHDGEVWKYIRNAIDLEIEQATRQFEKRIDNLNREIEELKMEKLRRQSQIEEAVQPTLASEWKKLAELEQKIADAEDALRRGPQVTNELDDVLRELASKILPPDVRVDLVDQIEVNPNNPRIHYQIGDEEVAKAELGDLAKLLKENASDEVIDNHPAIERAIKQSQSIPETVRDGVPLPKDWHQNREFIFDGERVKGLQNAYNRLYYKSERLAWTDEGLTPPDSPVKHERKAVILLGPPASGKSSLANPIARDLRAMIIDPDEVKKALPEYQDGIGAHAVHEESSRMAKGLTTDAMNDGANLLIPKVGDKIESIKTLTQLLKENGYDVEITLMQVDPKEVRNRMFSRFLETGRFVPPSYLKAVGNKPSKTYDVLKKEGVADGYSKVDNNGPRDQAPTVLEDTRQSLEGRLFRLQRGGGSRGEMGGRVDEDPGGEGVFRGNESRESSPKSSKQRLNQGTAEGAFFDSENLIQITRSALDPEQTLRHETIHALRAMNLFNDNEWALLEKSAKEFGWVEKHNITQRYDGVFEGDEAARQQSLLEESIAEEFSKWQKGQLEVTPEVQTIFERIKQILGDIAKSLKEVGVNSYEDIFKMIDDGEFAGRARAQKEAELQTLQNRYEDTKNNIDRLEQFKFVPPEMTPSDVQDIISVISKDKKPKKPQTLTEFLAKSGGITDEDRALSKLGVTIHSHPKLVVSARDAINENFASVAEKIDKGQPLSIDDAAFLAWNEGFFPELPSRQKFLKTLKDDLENGESVRYNDITKLNKHNDIAAVEAEAARLGITDGDQSFKFGRTPYEGDVVAAVARILDLRADEKISKLEARKSAEEIEFNNKLFPIENDLDGHADEIVSDIYNKLTGRLEPEYIDKENIIDFGFLKNRTFGIRDELIEEFLEDDIELIMRRYVRNVAGQIEMKKRFGNLHLRNHKQVIQEEFEALRQEVQHSDKSPNQKEKALTKLDAQEKDVIRSINFARDKILGRYEHDLDSSGWARTVDAALSWQYMTSLGGVLLTSSLDVWRHPMQQGFGRVFGKHLPALIAGNKGTKINRELARKYAGIAEIIHNSRLAHIAGLNDPSQVRTPAEIAIQKMVEIFSKLTGLPYWNQFHKEFTGVLIIDRAVENMIKGIDNISAKEARWMRHLGLGDMATQAKSLQASGALEKVQGIWTINPDKLPDFLVEQFFAGVKKEIDTTIISKGMGDAPLFTETKIGQVVSQFKSFGASSNQRMLIRGMQDDTGNFVGGMAGMITSGMFVYMLKQLEAGREVDDNPRTWLVEGIDRSGLFFLFFEANNIWEKAGGYGVYQALGAKDPASRFASRNTVGAALGPLFGSANDLLAILGNGARLLNPNAEFDPTAGDVKALRRLLPYATLPYWRWLVDGYIVPTMQEEVK